MDGGDVGAYTSLTLDSMGHPHISYSDGSSENLKYAHHDGTSWQIETLDETGDVGLYTSIAVDSNDHPRISYYDFTNADLKYAYHNGTTWQITTVVSSGIVGAYSSLAIDSLDRPHISYYDSSNDDLQYAHHNGVDWQITTVESQWDVGRHTSIALDATDHPTISYYSTSRGLLRVAHYDGGSWRIETADVEGKRGEYTSLALDTAGHPHVSYYQWPDGSLKYAHYNGTSWQIKIVDTGDPANGDVGVNTSLVLDGSDYPHISYYDMVNSDLKYAHYDGATWQIQIVDAAQDVGVKSSLALDAAGHPHISYNDNSNKTLKYAYYDGVDWQIETVDTGDVGTYNSLALDAAGHPRISYYDANSDDLKYAAYDGVDWQIEAVDLVGNVGKYSSLALDTGGRPHISYYDADNNDLKYAYHDGLGWQIETVDETGDVGQYTSLALDNLPNGAGASQPYISYYDHSTFDIKVAYHDGLAWQIGPVDGPDIVGIHTSLALNPAGQIHVSYFDMVNSSLKYATLTCLPVTGTSINGPALLLPGETGLYTATYYPALATPPVEIDWNNGTVGATAVYSWTESGTYTLAVTATNECGEAQGSLSVTVFCQPVVGVDVDGPTSLPVGLEGLYQASALPISASLPLTFTWDNGSIGSTAVYSWTEPGTYTLAVTATNECGEAQESLSVTVFCQPVVGVDLDGPTSLPIGLEGLYQASALPISASLPLTFTWDNGTVGASAVYSWTETGTYTLTVTATNECGEAQESLSVRIISCQPVETVTVGGPAALLVGEIGAYTATYMPITASLPLTFTWAASGGGAGTVGATTVYSWTEPGTYTLAVTATNECGEAQGGLSVRVISCQPVETVTIGGPAALLVGEIGAYTATYMPISASLPLTFTWAASGGGAGTVGATAIYSWTEPGTYTLAVTATNECGVSRGELDIVVSTPSTYRIYLPLLVRG